MNRSLRKLVTLTCSSVLLSSQTFVFQQLANSQEYQGATGCPAGTREGPINLVFNGNFEILPGPTGFDPLNGRLLPGNPAGFASTLPYRGNTPTGEGYYPDDDALQGPVQARGGLSIQRGAIRYSGTVVVGEPFPGDPANGIPGSNTYLYSNPNASPDTPLISESAFRNPDRNPVIWSQVLGGLSPNTSYNFTGYFYNLLSLDFDPNAFPPSIRLLAGQPGAPDASFIPTFQGQAIPRQVWTRVQGRFNTANSTQLELRVVDETRNIFGDDFGMTAVGFRECIPIMGVSKNAGTPINNGNGTFTIPYTVTVRNFAPVETGVTYDLRNLQLVDDLTQTFANASSFTVQPASIQSPTLAVNPNFTGVPGGGSPSSNQLLQGTDTLPAATTATVTFRVIVTPGTGPNGFGAFENQVTANATSQGGAPIPEALSNDGVDPDLDRNGQPDPPSQTQVTLVPGPLTDQRVRLVKRITNVTRGGVPLAGVNFGEFVNDPTSTDDDSPGWAQLPPIGVINIGTNTPLQSGDEITYTIYFLSDGDTPAQSVNICDPIPVATGFVANSTQIQRPLAALASGGAFFPPLAPLPVGNPCANQTNPNGSVIYDVGDVSNQPGSNSGLVRFRVRIN